MSLAPLETSMFGVDVAANGSWHTSQEVSNPQTSMIATLPADSIRKALLRELLGLTMQSAGSEAVSGMLAPLATLTPAERDFEEQREAFFRLPQVERDRYSGQFVACHEGQIVDHDPDVEALTQRFFRTYGNVPVYITKVGAPPIEVHIDTPFLD